MSLEKVSSASHCSLCYELPHRRMDVCIPIFLDIDGVMIAQDNKIDTAVCTLQHNNTCNWKKSKCQHLNKDSQDVLSSLISRIKRAQGHALIVLTDAKYRDIGTLKHLREEVFSESFRYDLYGETAPQNYEYGMGYENVNPDNCSDFQQDAYEKFALRLDDKCDVIEYWLKDHGFDLQEDNFIVFDDTLNHGKKRFGQNYIKVDSDTLLSQDDINKACEVCKIKY